jgi:hypothetical protein
MRLLIWQTWSSGDASFTNGNATKLVRLRQVEVEWHHMSYFTNSLVLHVGIVIYRSHLIQKE